MNVNATGTRYGKNFLSCHKVHPPENLFEEITGSSNKARFELETPKLIRDVSLGPVHYSIDGLICQVQAKSHLFVGGYFAIRLDVAKLSFHLAKEILLLGERIARLLNELLRCLLDVVWATEASLKSFNFAAKL